MIQEVVVDRAVEDHTTLTCSSALESVDDFLKLLDHFRPHNVDRWVIDRDTPIGQATRLVRRICAGFVTAFVVAMGFSSDLWTFRLKLPPFSQNTMAAHWTMVLPILSYRLQCLSQPASKQCRQSIQAKERFFRTLDTKVSAILSSYCFPSITSALIAMVRETFCEGDHAMSEFVKKPLAQEQQAQKIEAPTVVERIAGFYHRCDSRGDTWRLCRRGRYRAGQVLAEIAEWSSIFRLQGIRGLVCRLHRQDRRTQGNRCRSGHDQGI